MTKLLRPFAAAVAALMLVSCSSPADPEQAGDNQALPGANPTSTALRAVPFVDVALDDPFWSPRLQRNREVTIPHILDQNEITGRVDNFRKGAGLRDGPYEGRRFNDTDVYKIIEAASYALAAEYDASLDARVDELIALIAANQQEDGYLVPARAVDPDNPAPGLGSERWIHVSNGSHELYNAGHLIEAAVAHHAATGKRSLLDVAIRFADLIAQDFGPDARRDVPGHEEIELALVKLADATGEPRYVELARFFLDERGRPHDGEEYPEGNFAIYNDLPYKQDHMPVIEQTKASGHAVRAMYLYTGMADVAARTDAPGYQDALERIWEDVVGNKLYLTGGVGSRGTFESFGEDYELPNRAYAETCAAVGNDLWNHRMFLASGDTHYLDVMERVLYNGFLSGVSVAGDSFFYTNPLESGGRDERSEYFDVACCPANLARLMALLPGFVYATRGDEVWVNLYVGSTATVQLASGASVSIEQRTRYPWTGAVALTLDLAEPAEFGLHLRVPGWARGVPLPSDLYTFADPTSEVPTLRVNGEEVAIDPAHAEAVLHRLWHPGDVVELTLPMPVRRVVSHEAVVENRGRVALQRGPLVYAVEGADHGGAVADLVLPDAAELNAVLSADPDSQAGSALDVVVIEGPAEREGGAPVQLVAVPYFAWGNRGPGEMRVWIPSR